jgi:hypothetical protein
MIYPKFQTPQASENMRIPPYHSKENEGKSNPVMTDLLFLPKVPVVALVQFQYV